MQIDAKGLPCPQPVILAKKELDRGCEDLTVQVDNQAAMENLSRLGKAMGLHVETSEAAGAYAVRFTGKAAQAAEPAPGPRAGGGRGYAVFIGKDCVGGGDATLGYNLLKMALYTLSQSDEVPASVLFMNAGVKLPAGEETQVFDSLQTLIERGTAVLVCGTCLNYYGLTERLKIGTVSNMYDIISAMQKADKVISL